MSGKMSRAKGSRGELEAAKIASEHLGLEINRTPNSGGLWIPGDIQGIPGFHVEVKRQEKLAIDKWWEQSVQDCPENTIPIVVFRKNSQKWRVVIDYNNFLDLVKKNLV